MSDVFIKMSSSAEHQGCGQLFCVLSPTVGSLAAPGTKGWPGIEQGPGLFPALRTLRQPDCPSTEAGVRHDEPGKLRHSVSPTGTNLGVRCYTDFGTRLISTAFLKQAKLTLFSVPLSRNFWLHLPPQPSWLHEDSLAGRPTCTPAMTNLTCRYICWLHCQHIGE